MGIILNELVSEPVMKEVHDWSLFERKTLVLPEGYDRETLAVVRGVIFVYFRQCLSYGLTQSTESALATCSKRNMDITDALQHHDINEAIPQAKIVSTYSEILGLLECTGEHTSVSHIILSDTTVAIKTEVEEVEHLGYQGQPWVLRQ